MKRLALGLMMMLSLNAHAKFSPEQAYCLALNIYHEARGEGMAGWLAVAFVTVNRYEDRRFPSTSVCAVVYDSYQFSWTHDNIDDKPDLSKKADRVAWRYIEQFSKSFLDNYEYLFDNTYGSLYYHSIKVKPFWSEHYNKVGQIGEHIFYSDK